MDNGMKLDGVGARLPYRVPQGAFDELERNVLESTIRSGHGRRTGRITLAICGAAASLAIAVSLITGLSADKSFDAVQAAFAQLSSEDKAFLTEIYDEDTFLNINY